MISNSRYRGILFMLFAALGFSVMGGAAKMLKDSFSAGLLVFFRNGVGLIVLLISFSKRPAINLGGKFYWLIIRGLAGTAALYALLYCILHIPLGTAMTYNLTSVLFIALLSFFLFKEYHGRFVLFAVLLGFGGMILVYKPSMHFPWYYHAAGVFSGIASAIAYITVGRIYKYFDSRVIVLSFVLSGILVPAVFMLLKFLFRIPADDVFFVSWHWPGGKEWFYVALLGLAAVFGQYFVTLAYGADKAGIVSVAGYANIVFSVFIGVALGDAFPGLMSWAGICCIMASGIIISLVKRSTVSGG